MINWSERFFELANHVSKWSKDTSTRTCAVIATTDNRILSIGYNGLPSGCDDSVKERYDRPMKYLWTEHAERNAIYNAARNGININGSVMYVNWFPCADCTRAIIQSGIKKLICKEPDFENKQWGDHFIVASQMLKECGVIVEYV